MAMFWSSCVGIRTLAIRHAVCDFLALFLLVLDRIEAARGVHQASLAHTALKTMELLWYKCTMNMMFEEVLGVAVQQYGQIGLGTWTVHPGLSTCLSPKRTSRLHLEWGMNKMNLWIGEKGWGCYQVGLGGQNTMKLVLALVAQKKTNGGCSRIVSESVVSLLAT